MALLFVKMFHCLPQFYDRSFKSWHMREQLAEQAFTVLTSDCFWERIQLTRRDNYMSRHMSDMTNDHVNKVKVHDEHEHRANTIKMEVL